MPSSIVTSGLNPEFAVYSFSNLIDALNFHWFGKITKDGNK